MKYPLRDTRLTRYRRKKAEEEFAELKPSTEQNEPGLTVTNPEIDLCLKWLKKFNDDIGVPCTWILPPKEML